MQLFTLLAPSPFILLCMRKKPTPPSLFTALALRLMWMLSLWSAAVFAAPLHAQCGSTNNAFQAGEILDYELYFNWQFLWVKVGSASLDIARTTYQQQPAYRANLITRTSQRADRYFRMRDTLTAYTTLQLEPLYYAKKALEKNTYRLNQVWYTYDGGKCNVRMSYAQNYGQPQEKVHRSQHCAYDMISMLLRARSFDASTFRKGHRIHFLMADGKRCEWQYLVYRGKDTFKVEGSNTKYRCLVFSFIEKEEGKEKEIAQFYITDDKNHMPVRIDLKLRFGAAKAYLKSAQGLRHPQTSILQ